MNTSERAAQIWPLLAHAASQRQTITYAQLGRLIGVPQVGLGQLLEPIQSYCLLKRLPPLSILVVQEGTGIPGTGFIAAENIPSSQALVFAEEWPPCPKPADFAEATRLRPSNGQP